MNELETMMRNIVVGFFSFDHLVFADRFFFCTAHVFFYHFSLTQSLFLSNEEKRSSALQNNCSSLNGREVKQIVEGGRYTNEQAEIKISFSDLFELGC